MKTRSERRSGYGGVRVRSVIDEDLIVECIKEDRMAEAETQAAVVGVGGDPEESVDLRALKTLSISFRNVAAINNLQGFETLVKLQLDNNVIERIEGLEMLVNLEWLDLSFNNIRKIENLDKLVNLTDLSLFHNCIQVIEGLDKLTKLNILSLGDNDIREVDQIKTLRKYKNLRLLNLKGNPVCAEDDYQPTVFAFLPQLKYLDYEMIEPGQIQKARDRMLDMLVELEEEEKLAEVEEAHQRQTQKEFDRAKEANLEGVLDLFDSMLAEDTEWSKLKTLPMVDRKVLKPYRDMFQSHVRDFVDDVLANHEKKENERTAFMEAMTTAKANSEQASVAKVQAFDALRKRAIQHFAESYSDGVRDESILDHLRSSLMNLSDELMELEMLLVEQIDKLVGEFEESYGDLVSTNVNRIQSAFSNLEASANFYVETLQDFVQDLLSRSDDLEDDVDVAALLADKDIIKNTVQTSSDNQLNRIVSTSDEILERETKAGKHLIESIKKEEYQRNRTRVAEIYELVERHKAAIDDAMQATIDGVYRRH